jgi:fructokinase
VAHIVKASGEDIGWLYPGESHEDVSGRWLDLGALVVVVTDGPRGAYLFRAGAAPVYRPGHPVRVADTIGAGDAFTAGLLGGLSRRGLHSPGQLARWPSGPLAEAVEEAVLISALTCERVGADPPYALRGPGVDPRAPLTAADLGFG